MGNILILEVCRTYGWTYQEYLDQPQWFIELAIERMRVDAIKAAPKARV